MRLRLPAQTLQLSSLFSGSDVDGDTLTYYLYDANAAANSGHFVVGGNNVPAETVYALTAAQLAQATFVAGAAGTSDDIYVQAYDGLSYSGWTTSVHVAVPGQPRADRQPARGRQCVRGHGADASGLEPVQRQRRRWRYADLLPL